MSHADMNSPDCTTIALPDRLIGAHVREVLEQLRAAQDAGASTIVLDAARVRVLGVAGAQLVLSAVRTLEDSLVLLDPHPSFVGTLEELGLWEEVFQAVGDAPVGADAAGEEEMPACEAIADAAGAGAGAGAVDPDLADWDMGLPDPDDPAPVITEETFAGESLAGGEKP